MDFPRNLNSNSAGSSAQPYYLEIPKGELIDKLRAWLMPTDYLSPGNEYMKHLNSYVAGTGDWLRDSEAFREWEDGSGSGCLWVKGVPGSGKSVFAASTLKTLAETEDREGNSAPVLFFFFRQIVEKNHDPKYLVRDWAAQLLPFSQVLRERLHALSNQSGVDGIEHTKLWDVLLEALGSVEKVYCVADALDEMDDQHAFFVEKLRDLGLQQPEKIKVMLTSRPIPRLEKQLRHTEVKDVKLDPTQIHPDIVCYIASRLKTLEPRLSTETEEKVKEAICSRAEGLFLYARLIMDSLTEGLLEGSILESTLPTSLEALPMNLKELYTRMLAEHSRRSGITQEQQLTILQCVVYASRPLRLIELGSIIALLRKETGAGLKEGKDLVRQACGRLLEILEDESVSVIHHSLTEFARDQSRSGELGAFPVLDAGESQRMMLQVCLQYLDACETPEPLKMSTAIETPETEEDHSSEENVDSTQEEEDGESYVDDLDYSHAQTAADQAKHLKLQDLRSTYPLIDYASQNITYHIEKVDAAGLNTFDLLDSYFAPGHGAFNIWLLKNWKAYRLNNIQTLHIAAYLGLTEYVRHLIANGSFVDGCDGEGRSPLMYAAENGHANIASLLLSNGANPDLSDRIGEKPLHFATQSGKIQIVKLLLAAGVSPRTEKTRNSPWMFVEDNFGSDLGETPMQNACENGNFEVVALFIKCMNEEDACRCLHWTREAVVAKAILKTGKVPVDVLVDGVTALVRAADRLDSKMIEVLLSYGADVNLRADVIEWYEGEINQPIINYKSTSAIGPTPLHAFAGFHRSHSPHKDRHELEKCLKLLIAAGGDVNARFQGEKEIRTPLHYAVKTRHTTSWDYMLKIDVAMTELLLEHGADANITSETGATALHCVSSARADIVEILLKHGADVNAKDKSGSTPLLRIVESAASSSSYDSPPPEAHEKTILKLLEYGADIKTENDRGMTVFHSMFAGMHQFKNVELWKKFVEGGADINKRNNNGSPPLLAFKSKGQPGQETLLRMLVAEGLDLNATNSSKETKLFKLLKEYDLKLPAVQALLDLGYSPQARGQNGESILHKCIREDVSFEIFLHLVKAGADPMAIDDDGNNIFHCFASIGGNSALLPRLEDLANMGVPTDTLNKAGKTPLILACATATRIYGVDYAEELLDFFLNGKLCPVSDINAIDPLGASPLHYAASFSEIRVKLLLQAGAVSTAETLEGLTPLHIAARGRASNVIGHLLDHERTGTSPVIVDATDNNGCTALHYACRSGRLESVRYLLSAGANVFSRDLSGRAPLHALAEFPEEDPLWTSPQEGYSEAAGVTLGDLKKPYIKGRPRFSGVPPRTKEILEMLEMAGADLKATWMVDGEAQTPMDVAVRTKCTELVNEFRRRGISANDSAAEDLIPQPGNLEEAKRLLARFDKTNTYPHSSEYAKSSKRRHGPKFEEILKQQDHSLFHEFVKAGGDLLARGEGITGAGLFALVRWGYADLLERYSGEAARMDDQEWLEEEYYPVTLLGLACGEWLPRLDIIKVLVETVKVDVNRVSDIRHSKQTPLHILAAGSHFWNIQATEYLLDHGAEIESRNDTGETPLIAAMSASPKYGMWKEETIRLLLKHGANPNALRDDGRSCLNLASNASMTSILLKHGADILAGRINPLVSAVASMDLDTARTLLDAGADPNCADIPLYQAARPDGRTEKVELSWLQAQRDMVALFLERGANPFVRIDDDSPVCVDRDNMGLVKKVKEADLSLRGSTVIQKILEEHGVVDLFWELPTLALELKGAGGRTPLISTCYPTLTPQYTAYNAPKPKPVCLPKDALLLIQKGANVSATDDLGRTAFHWLCTLPSELTPDHQTLLSGILTRSPASLTQKDNAGLTPWHILTQNPHTHIWLISFLHSRGINANDPDPDGNTILHHLAPRLLGEEKAAKIAADIFKSMLTAGVPINHPNNLGETPLHRFIAHSWKGTSGGEGTSFPTWAIEHDTNHVEILPLFVEAGADLQTRNGKGENLLHATAGRWRSATYPEGDQREDMLGIFKELMKRGVDPRAEDGMCRTAIDVAVASGNEFLVKLFAVKDGAGVVGVEGTEKGSEDESEGDGGMGALGVDDIGVDEDAWIS